MIISAVSVKVIDEAIFSGVTRGGIGKGKRVKEVILKSLKEIKPGECGCKCQRQLRLKRMRKNCGP